VIVDGDVQQLARLDKVPGQPEILPTRPLTIQLASAFARGRQEGNDTAEVGKALRFRTPRSVG
jgi:hypothetical protein